MIMNKMLITIASVSMLAASPLMAAEVVHNSNPSVPFTYGSGNDYTPANASVLTTPDAKVKTELAARFHITGEQALESVDGVYSFDLAALGTNNISFDYSIFGGNPSNSSVKLTNLLSGTTASFNPFSFPFTDGNGELPGLQGSQRLGFGFLNGGSIFGNLGFNPSINNTYRFDLTSGENTLTTFAKVGEGAIGAVPEPSTWALMLLGFAAVGFTMRRSKETSVRVKFA